MTKLANKQIWLPKKNHLHLNCDTCERRAPVMYASILHKGVRIYFCSRHCAHTAGVN